MTEVKNPCQEFILNFAALYQGDLTRMPVAFRLLAEHGKPFNPRPDIPARLDPMGKCYMNAYRGMSVMNYAEGYGMKTGLPPLAHAWSVNAIGEAVDTTWGDKDGFYFGCEFSSSFVYDMAFRTGHYGIFESLYQLKMDPESCYDFLVSGLKRDL
jgi:hypothetical protein